MQQGYETILDAILRILQQKYQQLDGIRSTTEEMDALAGGEDPVSFGLYMDMRGNHMRQIDKLDAQMEEEIAKLPAKLAEQVRGSISAEGLKEYDAPILLKLREADTRNRNLHARILTIDQKLTKKINPTEKQE